MTIKERVNKLFKDFSVSLKAEEVNLAEETLENGTVIFTDAEDFEEGADVYIINDEGEKIPLPQGDYPLADGGVIAIADGGKVSSISRGGDSKEGAEGDAKVAKGNPSKGKDPEAKAAPAEKKAPKKGKKSSDLAEVEEEVILEVLEDTTEEKEETSLSKDEAVRLMRKGFTMLGEVGAYIELPVGVYVIGGTEYTVEERVQNEGEENEYRTNVIVAMIPQKELEDHEDEEKKEEEEEKEEMTTHVLSLEESIDTLTKELFELRKQAAHKGLSRAMTKAPQAEVLDLTGLSTEERIIALANKYNA